MNIPQQLRAIKNIEGIARRQGSEAMFKGVQWQRKTWAFAQFAAKQLKVVNKSGQLVPFVLNHLQRRIWLAELQMRRQRKKPWILVLKYRKGGVTTLQQGIAYHTIWAQPNAKCLSLAHAPEDTREIFATTSLFYDEQQREHRHVKTQATVMRLEFPKWGSVYRAESAGKTVGRGQTLARIHLSEAAFYRYMRELHSSLANSQRDDCAYILESTPNGRSGHGRMFYDYWQEAKKGKSPFLPLFFPWHGDPKNQIALLAPDELDTMSEEEAMLRKRFNLTLEQMKWWRTRRLELSASARASSVIYQEHPCVAFGVRVGTSRGLVPIEDVEVGALTDHGEVLRKIPRGVKATVQISTDAGYRLRCTPDHRIALADGGFVEAGDSKGKAICLERPVLADELYVARWTSFGGVENTLTIDEEWGRFLGYFMGDGSFHANTLEFALDKRSPEVVEDVRRLCSTLFGVDMQYKDRSPNGCVLRVSRKAFLEVFQNLGIIKGRQRTTSTTNQSWTKWSRKICVPECIWRSPRPVVREFLRGLWEADGWVKEGGRTCKFFAKDEGFALDVQHLMLALGVKSHHRRVIHRLNGKPKEYPGSEVECSPPQSQSFRESIGFISDKKRRRLDKVRDWKQAVTGARARLNDPTATVTSVVPSDPVEVWDLTIDGDPVFSAGGLLVHNCDDESCFLMGGESFFASDLLESAFANCREPLGPGELKVDYGPRWSEIYDGFFRIWEEPVDGERYIIGVDPAEGVGRDATAIVGINARTGEQAFSWSRNDMAPDVVGSGIIAARKFGLGWLWKTSSELPAYVICERQNHGHALITGALKVGNYPIEHMHHDVDQTDDEEKQSRKAGWNHNKVELTWAVSTMLRNGFPKMRDMEVVASVQNVSDDGDKANFSGRDLAVAAGLCGIGLRYLPAPPSRYGWIGGKIIDFEELKMLENKAETQEQGEGGGTE